MLWAIKNPLLFVAPRPGSPPSCHCSSERGSPQKAPPKRKIHFWFFFIFWTAHNLPHLSSSSWLVTLRGQGSHEVFFFCCLVGFETEEMLLINGCFCQLTNRIKSKDLCTKGQADVSQCKCREKLNSQLSKCKETPPKAALCRCSLADEYFSNGTHPAMLQNISVHLY